MSDEQAEVTNETPVQTLEREVRERVLALRWWKRRGWWRSGQQHKSAPPAKRKPGGPDGNRDIVERLNYVASQLRGACKNPFWADAHESVLREAAREIRRLRGGE